MTARSGAAVSRMGYRAVQWMTFARAILVALSFAVLAGGIESANAADSLAIGERPFVRGGYDDKPHLGGLFGRIAVGGYLEAGAGWTRVDGITDELGVDFTRLNLLVSTSIRER